MLATRSKSANLSFACPRRLTWSDKSSPCPGWSPCADPGLQIFRSPKTHECEDIETFGIDRVKFNRACYFMFLLTIRDSLLRACADSPSASSPQVLEMATFPCHHGQSHAFHARGWYRGFLVHRPQGSHTGSSTSSRPKQEDSCHPWKRLGRDESAELA